MVKFGQCVLLFVIFSIQGCVATMTNTWDDNLNEIGHQRGGTFQYLAQGADFVIEKRRESGLADAKIRCQGRPVFIIGDKTDTYTSTGSIPVQQTARHSGTVGSERTTYSGTTSYTAYQPVTYSSNYMSVGFQCGDGDISRIAFRLTAAENSSPVCVPFEDMFSPGEARIKKILSNADTDDCINSQGWFRYTSKKDKGALKIHVFLGDNGKELCKKLENEIVQAEVPTAQVNTWLRKRLSCN